MSNLFKEIKKSEIIEQKGILHEYVHEESGARLFYLETKDDNKLFSVTFKTVPEDSTGVFHILEHSVLCGSKKISGEGSLFTAGKRFDEYISKCYDFSGPYFISGI